MPEAGGVQGSPVGMGSGGPETGGIGLTLGKAGPDAAGRPGMAGTSVPTGSRGHGGEVGSASQSSETVGAVNLGLDESAERVNRG